MSDDELVLDTGEAEVIADENHAGELESETPTETADEKVARLEKELASRDKTVAKMQNRIKQDTKSKNDEMRARMDYLEKQLLQKSPQEVQTLSRDQFDSDDDYVDARAEAKAEAKFRELQSRVQAETIGKSVAEKSTQILNEAAKIGGFDVDDFNGFSAPISEALLESDIAPKLVAHLHLNPDEVERISSYSPAKQIIEIGKLESALSATAGKSKAPAPIVPVNGRKSGELVYHANMTDAEYDKWTEQEHKKRR